MKNTALVLLLGTILLAACSAPVAPATPVNTPTSEPTATRLPTLTPSPVPSQTAAPAAGDITSTPAPTTSSVTNAPTRAPNSPTPIPPTVFVANTPAGTVNASTLAAKVIFGYQGWFSCPNDGSKLGLWVHWTKRSKTFTAPEITVDNWPDVSELGADERCPTGMKLPNGNTAEVFSSYNPKTVNRHFQWMKQYGIDGVAAQRFVTGLSDARFFDFRNVVLRNVRASAEANGRVFYVEYDATGANATTLFADLKKDWAFLVDELKITSSPAYLRDNGLPVLEVYGLGFTSHADFTAELAQQVVDYFKTGAAPQYRVTLIGGVPSYWRTGTRDSMSGPAWATAYRSFDVISPWSVTRYKTDKDADTFRQQVIAPDLAETAQGGKRYMPVVFPGFSWTNLNQGTFNDIPRRCGAFYWRQVYNAVSAGSKMLFVAMFDEVDEGTAMFKLAPAKDRLPIDTNLVSLDADGCTLPSDWYLQLGGQTGRLVRGELPLSADMPIKPK